MIINIVSREPVKELIKGIREAQKLLKPDAEHKPYFTEDPHIIIASKLAPWQYEERMAGVFAPSFHRAFLSPAICYY